MTPGGGDEASKKLLDSVAAVNFFAAAGGREKPSTEITATSDPANRLIFRHFDACGTDWFPAPCEDSESVAAMRYCVVDKADIPNTAITGLHEITGLHGHVRFHSGNNPLKDAPPPVPDRVSW